jgi:hypothetical protein
MELDFAMVACQPTLLLVVLVHAPQYRLTLAVYVWTWQLVQADTTIRVIMCAPLVPLIAQQLPFALVYALLVTLHSTTTLPLTHANVAQTNS